MEYKQLYIWVEGRDDELFFNRIIKPLFEQQYNQIVIRNYAGQPKTYVDNFITSINAMPQTDYILVADIDSPPCITCKKEALQKIYKRLDQDNTLVVIKEIESWYLAGVSDADRKTVGLRILDSTDSLTKEQFNQLQPRRFDSRIDFMMELLKFYSRETAVRKNQSLDYFLEKYGL